MCGYPRSTGSTASASSPPSRSPDAGISSLFEDNGGRLWVGGPDNVGYLESDRFVPIRGVPGGLVNAIAQDAAGALWVANWILGLYHVGATGRVRLHPWSAFGRQDPALRVVADPTQGGIWLGFVLGGIAHLSDARVRVSYTATNGLGNGRINDLRFDATGALWIATQGGLSRLKNGRIATLTARQGLPCDAVDAILEDDDGATWLYMTCGIARIGRAELGAWAAAVDKDPIQSPTIRATVLDGSDGVRNVSGISSYSPHAAKSGDGRLWFATPDGVTVLDPSNLATNPLAPPVHIEQIRANGETYQAAATGKRSLRLPPRVGDLQIDYTALSLVAPEKMRFRYKLEGWDRDWQDAGTRRQAFHTNLSPGTYRFRGFRILQEALGNAAKHAKAKQITVRLTRFKHKVFLSVTDDGVGFERGQLEDPGGDSVSLIGVRLSVGRPAGPASLPW